jgi:hypothetical protein
MPFLNNNMPSTYNIRKMTSLLLTFCKHMVYPYFFYEIKFIDYTIKIEYLYFLKLALYICTLLFMLVFLLKIHLDPLGFYLFRWIKQVPNLVST